MWMAGLTPLAKPLAEDNKVWSRVGKLVKSGSWGQFEQAGLMVSGRDSLTPTHYDGHHNAFLQLHGAKRFLLLGAEHTPNLYGFPALHPLDPLSRVDLEAPEEVIQTKWPKAREYARGASVVLEAGDVLIMPQGVWHQVHSLEPINISINLLFGLPAKERPKGTTTAPGRPSVGENAPGVVMISKVQPVARRPAALSELAKSIEVLIANAVGPKRVVEVVKALASGGNGGNAAAPEVGVVEQLIAQCLAAPGGEKEEKKAPPLPSVREFVQGYLDVRRYSGLPLR